MATSLSAPTLTSSKRWDRERLKTLERLFQVGRGVAHDEYIEFSIEGNTILYQVLTPAKFFLLQFYVFPKDQVPYCVIIWSPLKGEESEISAGKIRVEFIKSYRDNPKINAIVLIKVKELKILFNHWQRHCDCSGDLGGLPQAGPTPCWARGGWSCRWSQSLYK